MERLVDIGDKVRDPLDGQWRVVSQIIGEGVYFTDGGVMDIAECRDIRLPSEPIPEHYTVAVRAATYSENVLIVEADSPEEACQKAVEGANFDDAWDTLDDSGPLFVAGLAQGKDVALVTDGESLIPIPPHYREGAKDPEPGFFLHPPKIVVHREDEDRDELPVSRVSYAAITDAELRIVIAALSLKAENEPAEADRDFFRREFRWAERVLDQRVAMRHCEDRIESMIDAVLPERLRALQEEATARGDLVLFNRETGCYDFMTWCYRDSEDRYVSVMRYRETNNLAELD